MAESTAAMTEMQLLHDRSCRGESLTAFEADQLVALYAEEDAIEAGVLSHGAPSRDNAEVRREIDSLHERLSVGMHQIQTLSLDNAALKQEIAELQHQLTTRTSGQPV